MWRNRYVPAKRVTQEGNINYFENHFGVPFGVTPKEEKNNTVTVIRKSQPRAIFEVSVNNASISFTLASAELDHTFCQLGGGKSPLTDQFHKAFTTTGHEICQVFKEENWDNAINETNYYKHDFLDLPEDLAGEINCHGLIPLQSKKKKLGGNSKAYLNRWLVFMRLFGTSVM